MTPIEALLSLPEHGQPAVASGEVARELAAASACLVRRHAMLWSLTPAGQRFLAQFRPRRSAPVSEIVVQRVTDHGGPIFHLVSDSGTVRRVRTTELRRSLRDIQADNPDVKITFDFRRPGHVA